MNAGLRRRLGAAIAALAAFAALLGVVAVAGAAFSPPVTLAKPGATAAPQIASDADGDAVAVWEHYDGSINRIRARSISAAGVLGPGRTLSAAGQYADYPQIASDADGDAVAVWRAADPFRIQARTISAAGTLGAIKTLSGNAKDAPQIASDADGDAVAVWLGLDGSTGFWRVEARTISAAGTLGAIKTLSSAEPDVDRLSADRPQIASDADGDAVAVWEQSRYDSDDRIQARTISAAGALGPIRTLSPAGQGAVEPQIASDADGDAVAVWQRSDDSGDWRVQARTISAAGVLGPVRTLSAAGKSAEYPQIASDADGDTVAVWRHWDYSSPSRVQARSISAAGALGPVRTLSVANAQSPQIASDADGDAVAVWRSWDGGYSIQARSISAADVLGPVQTLSAASPDSAQIASDADGDAVAVWRSSDGGSAYRIQAAQGP